MDICNKKIEAIVGCKRKRLQEDVEKQVNEFEGTRAILDEGVVDAVTEFEKQLCYDVGEIVQRYQDAKAKTNMDRSLEVVFYIDDDIREDVMNVFKKTLPENYNIKVNHVRVHNTTNDGGPYEESYTVTIRCLLKEIEVSSVEN